MVRGAGNFIGLPSHSMGWYLCPVLMVLRWDGMVFDNTVRDGMGWYTGRFLMGWDGIRWFRVTGWDGNWWDGTCDGMGQLMPWRGGREDGGAQSCYRLAS